MAWVELGWAVFLLCVGLGESATRTRITFPGCDRLGWKCVKVQPSPIRYELEYVCQDTDGIIFSLWNFNAPTEIKYLKVANCSSVEIDLTCTNVGRQIERLHIKNAGVLNFTNLLYPDVAQLPEHVIFENIKLMPLIPEKTFKQMKYPLATAYRCAATTKPTDDIQFLNVSIGRIQQRAFYNLTEMKTFYWRNVKVEVMEPVALQVEMEKERQFDVLKSTFGQLDFKAFSIRSPKVKFVENKFDELPRNVIDSTSFRFDFNNNTVEKAHSFAFILLSQNITFEYNHFNSLKTSALQGIGPGLLENAFMSFGQLKFTYNFNNNTISHSDIGGLNPDWIAYKNVHSFLQVTDNRLPCSCKELGWITLRAGLGDEFTSMMMFNAKYLDKTNKNLCLNSPCNLPVTVMAGMHIKYGLCGTHEPMVNWCKKYKPNQNDFGFGPTGKMVYNKWQSDFPSSLYVEDSSSEIDAFEEMVALAQKTDDSNLKFNFGKYSNGTPKESYFKIEKSGLTDIDPMDVINGLSNSNPIEVAETKESTTTYPDIVFKDDEVVDINRTNYTYQMDLRNGTQNTTDVGFNTMKKEFEDNQKDFVLKTYEQWQAQRKKRMVYFKVYGNLVTLG